MIHFTITDSVLGIIADRLKCWYIFSELHSDGPFYVVNSSTCDNDVGYPGDKIAGPFNTRKEAGLGFARALLEKLEE